MKSKLNIKSILVLALISIFSLVFLNNSFAAVMGTINVDTANIRENADTDSKIVEQASKGESVEVVEKKGEWYKVKYNGLQGYLRTDLLELTDNNAQTVKEDNATSTVANDNTQNQETATNTEINQTQENQSQTQAQESNTENTNNENNTYITKTDIKLKLIPLVNGIDIKEIPNNTTISVLEVNNNWALVESGMDRGWVLFNRIEKSTAQNIATEKIPEENKPEENNQEEIKTEEQSQEVKQEENKKEQQKTEVAVEETKMYINWDSVNVREQATKESDVITSLSKATEVTVFAKDGDWSKVKFNGKEGYIKSSLLSETKPEVVTSRSLEQERQSNKEETVEEKQPVSSSSSSSGLGEEICNYARQYVGCKYVYGGTSPSGFDCSGFTQYVFKHFGININRTASAQASNGYYVPKSELQAGDLLIFSGHAGLYLGDGTFIHAANSRKGVIITSLDESYYVKNYVTARRVI